MYCTQILITQFIKRGKKKTRKKNKGHTFLFKLLSGNE